MLSIMNNISFTANYISSPNILRKVNNKFVQQRVSFVEIDPYDIYDRQTVCSVAKSWVRGKCEGLASLILKNICDIPLNRRCNLNEKYFAITTQFDNFEKLEPNKILALAQITIQRRKQLYLDNLQVHPDNRSKSFNPEFKKIGTTMLDLLKKIFPQRNIVLDSVENAVPFYEKNGFHLENQDIVDGMRNLGMIFER